MRILHLVHQYPPEKIGGVEYYTQTLAAYQASSGHSVAVVTPTSQKPPTPVTVEDGVRIYRIDLGPRSPGRVFADVFLGNPTFQTAWDQILVEETADIVHVQNMMGVPAAAVTALPGRQLPYVVTLNDYAYGCANAQLYTNDSRENCRGPDSIFLNCGRCALARAGLPAVSPLALPVTPVMAYRYHRLRPILHRARRVIPVSHFVKEMYGQMGFSLANFSVLPTGFDIPREAIAAARQASRPAGAPFRLVYVGGFSPQKGLHVLIEAFNDLPANAQLDLYGDLAVFPDYVARLRQLARHPRIRFHGRLPHDEIWAVLAQADLVAVPTLWYEASPLIIDEVFAAGSPLIASALGAMVEKIQDGKTGMLVPPGDPNAWQAALWKAYSAPEMLQEFRRHITPPLSIAEHARRLMSLYLNDA